QANAFRKVDFKAGVYDPPNSTVRQHVMQSFLCPSDGGPGGGGGGVAQSRYVACHNDTEAPIDVTNKGVFYLNSHTRDEDIPDGSSFTIFVSEKSRTTLDLGWMSGTHATLRNTGTPINGGFRPGAIPAGPVPGDDDDEAPATGDDGTASYVGGFGSRHPGGANAPFGGGSGRVLKASISNKGLRPLGHRGRRELLSAAPILGCFP